MRRLQEQSLLAIYFWVFLLTLGCDLSVHGYMLYLPDERHLAYSHMVTLLGHLGDLLEVAFGALIGALSATLHHSMGNRTNQAPVQE